MFWSSKTLRDRLPRLLTDFEEDRIDSANYTLSIGKEVYISPTEEPKRPQDNTKILLSEDESFIIPPGQFGFLMTEEVVEVPDEAIAFISIRASYKFRGLINVSGFHVDPGYKGRLIFAVFNAGPSPIHLSRGEQCFHIWYADLDSESNVSSKRGYQSIDSKLIQQLSEQVLSLKSLNHAISESENRVNDRMNVIDKQQTRLITIGLILLLALLAPMLVTLLTHVVSTYWSNLFQ